MDNIIDIELTGRSTRRDQKLWQYDYGQVLRIAGKEFPKVTEVQFSLQQSGGHTLDRIGTSDNGLLTVQIPNELLQNKGATSDYTIYAFVYLSGDGCGNTKYMIQLPVESRPEPTDPSEDPTIDPSIFKDAINSVNASAERAETAEKSAKESADKAKEYADDARKSKEVVENARDDAVANIGTEKESALRGIESKTAESLQKIQSQTEESQNSINQSIADATKKKTELDGAVSNATNAKGNLDKAVQSAGNAKTELDTSIGKAGEAKTSLDATVEQANAVDASLKEQIGSAEQIQANVEQIAKNKADISSLNKDIVDLRDKKITKFYASNQGEKHLVDSDNGKIQDMVIYGMSKQTEYKGINLFPPDTKINDYAEVSIPKGSSIFWITDGTPANGGNFRFFNEDKTENMWFEVDSGTTSKIATLTVDAKYVQNLIELDFDLSKMCLGVGKEPIYEPYTGGKPSPSPDYPQEIKSVVNPTVKVTNEDGTQFETVTLPYILNAIPVSSGGNYIDQNRQRWVSDEVDLDKGVRVQRVNVYKAIEANALQSINSYGIANFIISRNFSDALTNENTKIFLANRFVSQYSLIADTRTEGMFINASGVCFLRIKQETANTVDGINAWLSRNDVFIYYAIVTPIETTLTPAEIAAFNEFTTYYPVTNISVNSEQLDGYTVFNYPISMANGWNYVKQQLGDTRDYIYDMDAKAQDIDIQSAEAYVNSEYAVALTELEV